MHCTKGGFYLASISIPHQCTFLSSATYATIGFFELECDGPNYKPTLQKNIWRSYQWICKLTYRFLWNELVIITIPYITIKISFQNYYTRCCSRIVWILYFLAVFSLESLCWLLLSSLSRLKAISCHEWRTHAKLRK